MTVTADDILKTGPLNHWYLVCRSSEVADKPVRLVRLGQAIALWRDAAGAAHAIKDFCPHRGARLSMGHVVDAGLACRYHGVTVDGDGIVRAVPPVPDCPLVGRKAVDAYPLRETQGVIFLYFSDGIGDAVPELELPKELTSPEWSAFLYASEWNCNYRLPLDNRIDPMHASYLHTDTFTLAYGVKQSVLKLVPMQNGFYVERDNQRGVNIDHTEVVYRPGNNYWITTDIPYPKQAGGNFFRIISHVTPIDAERTYFWVFRAQKSTGWRRDLWRFLYKNRLEARHDYVVAQDRAIMEGIPADVETHEFLIQSDVGVARLRRMQRLEAEEQARRINEHRAKTAAE